MKKEKLKRIARRITAFAAAAMAATLAFPTGTEFLGINFGTSVVASAETMTDGNFDYTVNESTVTITKYNGSGGEVEIPATIDSKTVTSIGAGAFKDCTSLRSITIPDSVTSIGEYAFKGCSSLRSITILGSVTSIGGYAFHSCISLESINIPDSVTKIDRYTFTNCTCLSVITIPKNVTSIENSAFMGCSGLSSINVAEDNTKYISVDGVLFNKNKTELLFYPANKAGTSYAIPQGVTTIESNAFYENNNLVSITIPDGVTDIGAGAFDSCKKLTSVSIPASVNNIGTEAFNSCESLTAISVNENNSVYSSENGVLFDKDKTNLVVYPAEKSEKSYTVPNTVKHIFMNSFAGCVNLENITLNEGVENIDLAAFMGCTNLKSINIPSSVTAIGDRAFMSCTSLTEISVHADNSNYSSVDNVLFNKNKTTLIVYPGGKSDTSYSVPSSVTSVYSMAFLMCPNLESIAFPPSVTSFGYSVIIGCEKLASVFVPESAAFTNQIDPEIMFTSEVRYAVSDDKANITRIELGTCQTTVDIPETICGNTVVSVAEELHSKVGKHTHKWDVTNTCGLCGVNRARVFDITIAEPTAGEALATQASVICNSTEENCDIIWEPAPTDGIAAYGTAYTASVKITSGSPPVVTINGEAVDSSNITANVDGTFTVKHTFDATEKRTLTASDFSFAAPSDLVYNGSAKEAAVTTTVSGAGDITVKYYDESGDKLSSAPVNAGTYTVKIDVAAGDECAAAGDECAAANELTDSTWTFTIKRAAVTVTAKDYIVKLGDPLPESLEYETDGLMGTDTLSSIGANVTIGYANAGTPSAIGNYIIVVSGEAATTNYNLTYVNGTLSITAKKVQTITAADVTLTYGETGKKIGATTNGDGAISYAVASGDDVISVADDGTITALKAGTATVEITAAGTFDYAKATKTITVTVNKAAVTITANSCTVKVGNTLPKFDYKVSGLVNNEALPITVSVSCSATDSNTAGIIPIIVSGAAESTNYTFNYVNGTLTITVKNVQTITAADVTLTYGDAGKKIGATTNGDGAISYAVASGDDVISVADDGTITALKAGTATVEITAAETFDYAKATKTITVTVNKKKVAVTIKADDKTVYQNAALPTFTYSVTGLANGDKLSFTPVLTCEATTTSTVGTYAITVTIEIAEDECYTYTTQNGTLTVQKKSSGGGGGGSSSGGSSGGGFSGGSSGGSSGGGSSRPTTPTTTNPSIGGSAKSWSDVAADLGKLANGSEATIELNGNTTVPADVIKAIADKDSNVKLVIDSTFAWVVDGAEITAPAAADLTFIKTAGTKSSGLRGTEGTQFKINDTGVPTSLEIAFKKAHAGKFANLYKNVSGKPVFETCAKLGEDGKVILPDVVDKGDYVAMLCEFSDRLGDMDNDGIVNAKDAAAILKDIVEIEPGKNPLMADFNGDGRINAMDAAAILKRIVGLD